MCECWFILKRRYYKTTRISCTFAFVMIYLSSINPFNTQVLLCIVHLDGYLPLQWNYQIKLVILQITTMHFLIWILFPLRLFDGGTVCNSQGNCILCRCVISSIFPKPWCWLSLRISSKTCNISIHFPKWHSVVATP